MSQRTPVASITHPMFPDGDWKKVGAAAAVSAQRNCEEKGGRYERTFLPRDGTLDAASPRWETR
jgi:hypothetical protein